MTHTRRLIISALIALGCGAPALFEAGAYYLGPIPALINLPGLFLAFPHVPPEGFPGQSASGATLMLLAQTAVWFIILSVFSFFRAQRTQGGASKG